MLTTKYLLVILGGYLLGSLSVSILLSRYIGSDVRSKGSGNAGATNMARVFGMSAGVLTLAGDALKGAASMLVGWMLLGDWGLMAGGIACLVGHCFPIYYEFRGGKGVSVGAAVAFAVSWQTGLVVVGTFLVFALISKRVSLGSVCGAISITVAALIFHVSTPKLILSVVGMMLVVFQHRANIKRLIQGTEPAFKPKSAK